MNIFWQKIDIYGININLMISGKSEYHSLFSIFLSILFIILCFIYSYFFGFNLIFHKNPKTLQSSFTQDIYDYFEFNHQIYFSAWRVEDYFGNELNITNILYPVIRYYSYQNHDFEYFQMIKCKELNLSINIPDEIKEYYCMPFDGRLFGGSWDNNKIAYFSFSLFLCENGDNFGENSKCTEKTLALQALNNELFWYLSIYYPVVTFVPEEKESPVKVTYSKKFVTLNVELRRSDTFKIGKTIVSDDKNLILERPKNKTIWTTTSIVTDYSILNLDNYGQEGIHSGIYNINWSMEKDYTYYRRWYIKLPECLALISTLIRITDVVFRAISLFINKLLMYDHLFSFCWADNKDNSFLKKRPSLSLARTKRTSISIPHSLSSDLHKNNNYIGNTSNSLIQPTVIQKTTNFILTKNTKNKKKHYPSFHFKNFDNSKGYFGIHLLIFDAINCKRNTKVTMKFNLLIQNLDKNRDFLFLIKQFIEINVLKTLLLDNKQLNCLDYIKKEIINETEIANHYENKYNSVLDYIKKYKNSIDQKDKFILSIINRKLFQEE